MADLPSKSCQGWMLTFLPRRANLQEKMPPEDSRRRRITSVPVGLRHKSTEISAMVFSWKYKTMPAKMQQAPRCGQSQIFSEVVARRRFTTDFPPAIVH